MLMLLFGKMNTLVPLYLSVCLPAYKTSSVAKEILMMLDIGTFIKLEFSLKTSAWTRALQWMMS
jgi:hypothetical protein